MDNLKMLLDCIIAGNEQQAQVSFHSYLSDKIKQLMVKKSTIVREATKDQIDQVRNWLYDYNISNFIINPDDGSVNVDVNVDLSGFRETQLPIKFNRVKGHFDVSQSNLTSLTNCPQAIEEGFFAHNCKHLTSIIGCPQDVGGVISLSNNLQLGSLEGLPRTCGYNFNNLSDTRLYIENLPNLHTLRGMERMIQSIGWDKISCEDTPLAEKAKAAWKPPTIHPYSKGFDRKV